MRKKENIVRYLGIKEVHAIELSKEEACKRNLLRLDVCDNNEIEEDGYFIVYENGYESWAPKSVFEKAYKAIGKMTFGMAIEMLKKGFKVARKGWNGKGMFLFLVHGSTFKVSRPPLLGIYEEGTEINYHSHIDMKTATGEIVPWVPSQTDVLAEDWTIAA